LWADTVGIVGGISIPVFGCWEIAGHYKGQELKFTVWVTALPEQKPLSAEPLQKISEVPPTAETAPRRIQVDGETQAKDLVYKVTPDVPAGTEAANISGTIILQAVIKDGRTGELRYVSGPPLLAQAAIDAVKWWRYRAVIIDREAVDVEVDTTIEVVFSPPGSADQ
jgi:Gram-negative bacterial TonB protein C-terminal